MAEFKKCPRDSGELSGEWRLASVEEVKKPENLANIKRMGILNSRETARLLDGYVKENYNCVKQHNISKMEQMILIKPEQSSSEESRPSRTSDGPFCDQMYSGVELTSQGRVAAVLLSCEDKITEAICFVLYSIVQQSSNNVGKRQKELEKLIENLKDKFRNDRTVLHYAVDQPHNQKHGEYVANCLKDNFKCGKELIKAADINRTTVLHFAAFHGNIQLCKFLIQDCEMEADVTDGNGENLLHFAVKGQTGAVFEALCALPGVDLIIDSQDIHGKTALHKAAAQGNEDMITTLLSTISMPDKKHMFIHQADSYGQTALLEAARGGHEEAVKFLLKEGSDPLSQRSSDGRTALHYVVQLFDDEKAKRMAESLLKHLKHDVAKFLLLCISTPVVGTAEEYLKREKEKEKQCGTHQGSVTAEKYLKTERERTALRSEDLLNEAIEQGYEKIALEHLVKRGVNIARITNSTWSPEQKNRVDDFLKELNKRKTRIPEIGRDQPAMYDSLGRNEFAEGLAALFLNPYVKPPLTVGIYGDWGIGKSSLMIQTEVILLKTAAQLAFPNLLETKQFLGCRQIVQSPKDPQKYQDINKAVKDLRLSSDSASEDDPLLQFLDGDYQEKYHEVYKSLALMDRNEMFEMKDDEEAADSSCNQYSLRNIPGILTVRYNAWYYQNEVEAWAGLAVEITKAIEESMTRAQRVRCRWNYVRRERGHKILLEFFLPCLLALFLSSLVAWAVWKLLTRPKHEDLEDLKYGSIPATVLVVFWTVARQLFSVFQPINVHIKEYLQLPNHRTNVGYQNQVISDIKIMLEEIGQKPSRKWRFVAGLCCLCGFNPDTVKGTSIPKLPPPHSDNIRVIVFVDDLDRCPDNVILQVLSAVNLVLAACNISVVLGMDVKMIARATESLFPEKNNKPEELAEKYISKIVQLPLALPDTSADETERFLKEQLGSPFNQVFVSEFEGDAPRAQTEQSAGHEQPSADSNQDCVCLDIPHAEGNQSFLQTNSQIFEPLRRLKNCLRGRISVQEKTKRRLRTMSLHIQMIMPYYTIEERTALHYLSNRATGAKRLPREWKRFLLYHRIAWNILSQRKEVNNTSGWETQLVVWVFCCWQWRDQINTIIKNWKKLPHTFEGSEDSPELIKPSLKSIIDSYLKDKFKKDKFKKEKFKKEKEEWISLQDTLTEYDVSMECVESFQKFRLHCQMGDLSISKAGVNDSHQKSPLITPKRRNILRSAAL